MAQYEAITGRRPYYNLGNIIRSEAPTARSRYFNNLALQQQEAAQQQDIDQFNQTMKQQEEINKANQEQAATGNAISAIGTGLGAYSALKEPVVAGAGKIGSWLGIGGETAASGTGLGSTAATTGGGTAAAGTGAASTASGATGAGAGSSGAAGGGGASAGTIGGLAAIAAALGQLGVNNTQTEYEGHPTGGLLTFGKDGHWNPSFANEPGIGYMYQSDKLNLGPSSGEKFDAAMANQDYQAMGYRAPAAINQWVNPVGDIGYSIANKGIQNLGLSGQDADLAMTFVDPITAGGKLLEDFGKDKKKDEDVVKTVATGGLNKVFGF